MSRNLHGELHGCQRKVWPFLSETQQCVCPVLHSLHRCTRNTSSRLSSLSVASGPHCLRGEREREGREGREGTRGERRRERGERGERGERWVMDSAASHSGEAAQASPSSSPWQLIPRLSSSLTSCGGAKGRREPQRAGEKRAPSAEVMVLWRGTLTTGVITVEQAMGHCSSPRRPTASHTTAVIWRPCSRDLHCRLLGLYCRAGSSVWRWWISISATLNPLGLTGPVLTLQLISSFPDVMDHILQEEDFF